MRDDSIFRMHETNVRRVMLLLRQFEYLQTRMQAFEQILSSRWAILRAMINPMWLQRVVNNRQQELLSKAKQDMERAMAKPIIKTTTNGAHR